MICQYLLVGIDIHDRYIIFTNFSVHNTDLRLIKISIFKEKDIHKAYN
jgi:hypothetical protein